MKMTNLFRRFCLRCVVTCLVGFTSFALAKAQNCTPPLNLSAQTGSDGTVELRWEIPDPDPAGDASQWIVVIGGSGLDCENAATAGVAGLFVQPESPELEYSDGVFSYTFDGLAAGLVCNTSYRFLLTRTCAFMPADESGSNSSECVVAGETFKIPAAPFSAEVAVPSAPTCSEGDGTGSVVAVTITDGACCAGRYRLEIRDPATDAVLVAADNAGEGFTAADSPVLFPDLPVGDYRAVIVNTTDCPYGTAFDGTREVAFSVAPPAAEPPAELVLYELFGQELGLSGNGPVDLTPGGPLVLPTGDCAMTMYYYFVADSPCDGAICDPAAFSVDHPAAQLSTSGDCQYLLTWKLVPGQNAVTIAGAGATLTLTADVRETTQPVVSVAGGLDFTVPACAESITRDLVVLVDESCGLDPDQLAALTLTLGERSWTGAEATVIEVAQGQLIFTIPLTVEDNGRLLTASFTDSSGNEGVFSAPVSVTATATAANPEIIASDVTFTVPACSQSVPFSTTVAVQTDCASFDPAGFSVAITPEVPADDWQLEALTTAGLYRLSFAGLTPGSYTVTYQYGEVSKAVVLLANALPNTPPSIVFPGNRTITLPSCSDRALLTFALQIDDDCSDIDPAALELAYAPGDCADCPPAPITDFTLQNGQVTFPAEVIASSVASPTIIASYTDGGGRSTTDTVLIEVLQLQDTEPPVVVYPAQEVLLSLDPCTETVGEYRFSVTVRDNCASADFFAQHPELISVTTSDPAGSELIPEGENSYLFRGQGSPEGELYTITIQAADGTEPSANVTVVEFPIRVVRPAVEPFAVACRGSLNVSLDEDCELELTPAMALSGEFGCAVAAGGLLAITILDDNPDNGPVIDGCGTFAFEVNPVTLDAPELAGFAGCSGTVTAKDLTPPTVIPPEDTDVTVKTQLGLYCDQAQELTVNGIPADQRCYVVTADGINLHRSETESIFNYSRRNLSSLLNFTGYPRAQDNCGDVRICVSDQIVSDDPCAGYQILRTFRVTDGVGGTCGGSGETVQTTQTIYFRRPSIEELAFPDSLTLLDCDSPFLFPLPNGNPSPAATGYFTLLTGRGNVLIGDGSFQQPNGQVVDAFCNLAASFTDGPRVTTCANTYKFVRTWTLIDWCGTDGEPETFTYEQTIKVGDTTPPLLAYAEAQPRVFSTNAFGCTANFIVPVPATVSDNCSGSTDLLAFVYPGGDLAAAPFGPYTPGTATDALPRGDHLLEYVATDECGNESRLRIDITIADVQAPVAKCNDDFNLSLNDAGVGSFLATEIDAGSYDECSAVHLEVRRSLANYATPPGPGAGPDPADATLFTDWAPAVDFDCNDAGRYVRIELRVWDDGDQDGTFGSAGDNLNVCWLDLLVENKIPPVCVAPASTTVSCTELNPDLPTDLGAAYDADFSATSALLADLFGTAAATGACGAEVFEIRPIDGRDDCGIGTITRRFRALSVTSAGELIQDCTQTIRVEAVHEYAVHFPADDQFDCNIDPVGPDLEYFETGCDLLSIQRDTARFQATGDECYQLHQTIRIINWCEYDGTGDPFVIGRDEDGDGIEGESLWLTVANGIAVLRTSQTGTILRSLPDYANSPSRGFFEYVQVLQVSDNVAPVITLRTDSLTFCSLAAAPDCDGEASIDFRIDDLCTPDQTTAFAELDAFVFDANGDSLISPTEFVADTELIIADLDTVLRISGTFPLGRHAVRIVVTDGCGNTAGEIIPFEIIDCKAPAPICIDGLTVNLMPDGAGGAVMGIGASDFLVSPIDDCTGVTNYTIYRATPFIREEDPDFVPSPVDTGLILDCGDIGMLPVRIYATDGAGNSNYCETTITVRPSQDSLCFGAGTIAGVIATADNEPVPGVAVSLTGEVSQTQTTGADGSFAFSDLPGGMDYTLTPFLDDNPRNGVSTYDLILIQKHILGVQPLDSPYQLIAADANYNTTITTLDLIQLRRVILDVSATFGGPSWRFVAADHEFPNAQDPWQQDFPEIFNANDLEGEVTANFVAIKVGDVNGSAAMYAQDGGQARSGEAFRLTVAEQTLLPGAEQRVVFRGEALASFAGFQGTLELASGVTLRGIDYGLLSQEHFLPNPQDQPAVSFSWNGTATAADLLFALRLTVDRQLAVHEAIRITDRLTTAEAYTQTGDHRPVAIQVAGQEDGLPAAGLILQQNQPNPVVADYTTIAFSLPRAGETSLVVRDLTGRVRWSRRANLPAGEHRWQVARPSLGPPGMLWYTLTAGEQTVTRKMLVGR
jgi:hypothetical protein